MDERESPAGATDTHKSLAQTAAVAAPDSKNEVDDLIERERSAVKRQERLRAELRRRVVEQLETRRQSEKLADAKFQKFLATFSAVPHEQHNVDGSRYVPQGASILAANHASFQSGIQGRIKQAVVTGKVALTEQQATEFESANAEKKLAVATMVAKDLSQPKGIALHARYREFPPALRCREEPKDPCVEVLEGKKPADEGLGEHNGPGGTDVTVNGGADTSGTTTGGLLTTQPTPLMKADIPLLIDNLVKYMTPPEAAAILGINGGAGIPDIKEHFDFLGYSFGSNSVKGLALHSGPADGPSFFDFHHLQIAFEHVWHELFDDGRVGSGPKSVCQQCQRFRRPGCKAGKAGLKKNGESGTGARRHIRTLRG
jgi:hypothetical protein